jgi:hypothetical protein
MGSQISATCDGEIKDLEEHSLKRPAEDHRVDTASESQTSTHPVARIHRGHVPPFLRRLVCPMGRASLPPQRHIAASLPLG